MRRAAAILAAAVLAGCSTGKPTARVATDQPFDKVLTCEQIAREQRINARIEGELLGGRETPPPEEGSLQEEAETAGELAETLLQTPGVMLGLEKPQPKGQTYAARNARLAELAKQKNCPPAQ